MIHRAADARGRRPTARRADVARFAALVAVVLAVVALAVAGPALADRPGTGGESARAAAARDAKKAPTCFGRKATIRAKGAKPVTGTVGDDVIVGDAKANTIFPSQGNDRVCGGGGNDVIRKDEAAGTLLASGGSGNDDIRAGFGSATLIGGPGADRFDVNTTAPDVAYLLLGGPGADQFETAGVNNAVCVQSPTEPPAVC